MLCSVETSMGLTRHEWDTLLVTPDVDQRLETLQQKGVLREQLPVVQAMVGFGGRESKDLWAHTKQVVKQTVPVAVLRWAALFHDCGKPSAFSTEHGKVTFHHHEAVSARLFREAAKASGLFLSEEVKRIDFILTRLGLVEGYNPEWTDSAVRRLSLELGDRLEDVFAVARADCTTANPRTRRRVLASAHALKERILRERALSAIPPALPSGLGDALKAHLGLPAGRELGQVLAGLRARVEAGELPRNASYDVYIRSL